MVLTTVDSDASKVLTNKLVVIPVSDVVNLNELRPTNWPPSSAS